MGNIFRLSEKPSCYEACLTLIEESFDYQPPHSFEIDFAPLIDRSNHHNCFVLLDEQEAVIAHVGVKEKNITLNGRKYPIIMLGGIAVAKKHRGEGHFQTLFQDVLAETRSDTTLFLLWSDMEKLYNKFGFYLCGTQLELHQKEVASPFTKTKLHLLSPSEKKEIISLYNSSFAKTYLTLDRSQSDWELIEKISSADLFIQKSEDKISDYYFMNKGQDLPGIIYEYGTMEEMKALVQELSSYGRVWMGKDLVPTENMQYQFFMSPGDVRLFTEFISDLTQKQFSIRAINLMKQEIYFDFNQETISLELGDFLKGVFGPGTFEELDLPAIYLSGLESV
jgi:predicted N-acetyltransferase YhbS